MLALTAERRSPFQIQPRENPLSRVVSAVENFRNQVTDGVRAAGINITHRMQRSQAPLTGSDRMTQDADQLQQARANIADATTQTRTPVDSTHPGKAAKALAFAADAGKYVMTHKIETAQAVGRVGVKVAPTLVTAVAVNIAAGALAAPVIAARAVASGFNDVRRTIGSLRSKNIFATSETLRHGFGTVARSTHTESPRGSDAPPTLLQRIAQSPIGKVLSGYAHIEQNVTAKVVAHNAHISTIKEFGLGKSREQIESFVSTMTPEEMFKLRRDAVMARLTTDPNDVGLRTIIHNIHRATSLRSAQLKEEAAAKGPDSAALPLYITLEKQFKRGAFSAYRTEVYKATGAHLGANLVKTIGTSLTFFYGGHLFGLHSANPFEHSTFWSNIADKAKELVHRGGARVEDGITQLLNASTIPHAEAAELTLSERMTEGTLPQAGAHSLLLNEAIHSTKSERIDVKIESMLPRGSSPTQVVGEGVPLHSEPTDMHEMQAIKGSVFRPSSLSVVTPPSTVTEASTVLTSVSEMHTAGGTIQVDGTSLSQTLWNMRGTTTVAQSLPWLAQAKTLTEAYTSPDSAHAMWEHVILPSRDKIATEGFSRLQALFESPENAHASFAQVWKQYHSLYDDHFGGLDTWGYGGNTQTITLAVDHADTVGFADGSASATHAARMSIPEHETLPGGPKVLARLAHAPVKDLRSSGTTGGNIRPSSVDAASLFGNNAQTTTITHVVSNSVTNTGIHASASNPASIWDSTETPTQHITPSSAGSIPGSRIRSSSVNSADLWNTSDEHAVAAATSATSHTADSSHITPSKLSGADLFDKSSRPTVPVTNIRPSSVDARTLFDTSSSSAPASPLEGTGVQLDPSKTYNIIFASSSEHFKFPSNPIPVMSIVQKASGGYNTGSFSYNDLGGLNIELHTGNLKDYGAQFLEPIREYLQGGASGPRLGPVQEAYRAQQMINEYTHLSMTISKAQTAGGNLTAFHHVSILPDGSLKVPSTDLDGIIGGGPGIDSLIGCSRGHVQAIQMLLDHEADAPTGLQQFFAILKDPKAEGEAVESAVDAIVRQWFIKGSEYTEFYKMYGYLLGETPDISKLEKNGFFTAGRLVFEFQEGGGQ